MPKSSSLGGVIHSYQKYDPKNFPSPTEPPPDLVSPAFEHMLMYGSLRELSDEELANAVRLDPSQIQGLGPSLESLMAILRERKRKILETYETDSVQKSAGDAYQKSGSDVSAPKPLRKAFEKAFKEEQIRDLERVWYQHGQDSSAFARHLMRIIDRLGDKYQVEELASKYEFTGRESMTVPEALEIKEELETIDRLLEQLAEAAKTAQIGVIDMEALVGIRRAGRYGQARRLSPTGGRLFARDGPAARARKGRPRPLPTHAEGLPLVPESAVGTDI